MPEAFPIIVMKLGGVVAGNDTYFTLIEKKIRTHIQNGYGVVVIVSAIRNKTLSAYSTDVLLSLLPEEKYVCRRERDLLLSCGEIISAVRFSSRLREHGVSAVARAGFEAGIITDNEHGNANIISIDSRALLRDLHLYKVVIVAGFQGISQRGRITTLGRGGSDTTALALSAALKAEQVEIYTNTSGIFSGDPNVIPDAKPLHTVRAEDIRQMAWQQKHILHPRACEIAIKHHIPIIITNPESTHETHIQPVSNSEIEPVNMITGIAIGDPVIQLKVFYPDDNPSFSADIFQSISDAGISMDMFSITDKYVCFTISENVKTLGTEALKKRGFSFALRERCGKISIVGAGMHGMRGVMARFVRCLIKLNIEIFQTVDSHATISALIPYSRCKAAARALHREFIHPDKSKDMV